VRHRAGALVLRREDDDRVLCERCVLADTVWRRLRGLIGRGELQPGEGIVLRPSWSVHTFFLRYPIDAVFVDADQVVVRVVERMRPWRWATCHEAHDVVELRAGECARSMVARGQRLAWAARPGRPPEPGDVQPAPSPGATSRATANGTIRVLVGTNDDKFLRLARFLLTRKHFEVEATGRLTRTMDLVERQHPHVVVIDATGSLADAARAVAAIEALSPQTAVMVVCDGDAPRWTTGLKVAEKWEALETLSDDVELLAKDARAWP
jgi:uncharacterized membrane protein (UPF0127 family)